LFAFFFDFFVAEGEGEGEGEKDFLPIFCSDDGVFFTGGF
jgi:hypothetical protein